MQPRAGPRALGLDFGTTNTVLSWATPHHPADPVVFRFLSLVLFSFRSALTFWDEGTEDHPLVKNEAGPWAIQKFIEIAGDCRFIQSLKSFAASRLFEQTYVYGRAYRFEELFATDVVAMLHQALFAKIFFNYSLRSDPGVISAGKPKDFLAFHASLARQNILNGVVEHVPHVEHAGNIGRRNDDGVSGF
jgi:hypothetical chaperone protein